LLIILDFALPFPYITPLRGKNMKIFKYALAFILFLSLIKPLQASPQQIRMLFWYPGEAGSTVEAKGVLNSFFDHLNGRIAPYKISGEYFNTVPEGLAYLKKQKPSLAIISFAGYTINGRALDKNEPILKTLPLPNGKPTELYVVVGMGPRPAAWNTTIYTKQPLTREFVNDYVLGVGTDVNIVAVQSVIATLKDISSGAKKGGVILQPMEYQTFKNIGLPWTGSLSVWHTSAPIPSAPVIAMQTLSPDARQKIVSALLSMSTDPEGKKILETLRLKGFEN